MNPQQWLDEVRKELQTRRLPRRSVTRLMRELSDHLTDGWEQTMNTDVRVAPVRTTGLVHHGRLPSSRSGNSRLPVSPPATHL